MNHLKCRYQHNFASKMRLNILLFFSVLVSLGLFWTVNRRKGEEEQLLKRNKFQFIKLSVSEDVLGEYKAEISEKQPLFDKIKEEVKALESEAADHLAKETGNKVEVEACENAKVGRSLRHTHIFGTGGLISIVSLQCKLGVIKKILGEAV